MLPIYPKIIPMPVAENGNKNDIPQTTSALGFLSYNEGFQQINQIPVKAGGIAPKRNDFNGILNELSQHIFFLQNGGRYSWQDTLDYAAGAVELGSNGVLYKALQNSGPHFGGAKDPVDPKNSEYWKLEDIDSKIDKSAISSVLDSESEETVASSKAVKMLHDKMVKVELLEEATTTGTVTLTGLTIGKPVFILSSANSNILPFSTYIKAVSGTLDCRNDFNPWYVMLGSASGNYSSNTVIVIPVSTTVEISVQNDTRNTTLRFYQ